MIADGPKLHKVSTFAYICHQTYQAEDMLANRHFHIFQPRFQPHHSHIKGRIFMAWDLCIFEGAETWKHFRSAGAMSNPVSDEFIYFL